MASTVTTFAVFQALLLRSIDQDAYLDTATKAALKTRVQNLVREDEIVLDYKSVQSTAGFVSTNPETKTVDVAVGSGGTNRIEFTPLQYLVPLQIKGTEGIGGFLPGHVGSSSNTPIVQSALTLQYRLASADSWASFDRNTVLDEVTWVQFAVKIADQVGIVSVPAIHIHAEQV